MEISAEKTKLMTNSVNGIQREIKVKGQKLGTVTSFKYLGAVVSDDGSKPEVLSRIAQATAALTKLKPIWRDNNISLWGWSGGAMVLGKPPVPGRPTILIIVGQGPVALAVGAGGGGLDIFTLIYPFSSFSLSLGDGLI